MRRWPVLMLVLACSLLGVSPALADDGQQTTTLLTPSGQPVGGAWQLWMNDSYMPTYNGPMVLDLYLNSGEPCSVTDATPIACTSPQAVTPVDPSLQADPETTMNIPQMVSSGASPRDILLYEQGHVIDQAYLTDAQRLEFLSLWGQQVPTGESVNGGSLDGFWWGGETSLATGNPVMGEWFSEAYMLCAVDRWTRLFLEHHRYPPDSSGVDTYPAVRWYPKPRHEWTLGDLRALRMQQRVCRLISSLG